MDPRVTRTRNAILRAAEELLKSTAVTEFTVASVCAKAGVSRVAFYDRFGSLDAMFGVLMEEELTAVRHTAGAVQPVTTRTEHEPPDDLVELFETVGGNSELYRAMLDETGNLAFMHQMREALRQAIAATMHRIPESMDWPIDLDTYYDFIAGATLSVVIGWLRQEQPAAAEEMARQLWWLIARRT